MTAQVPRPLTTAQGVQASINVMAVFAEAAERNDARMRNIYFDVATNVTAEATPADGALVAKRIRQVGLKRVLYGSDLSPPGGSIRSGWEIFRNRTPLTAAEFRAIAGNLTRFARLHALPVLPRDRSDR